MQPVANFSFGRVTLQRTLTEYVTTGLRTYEAMKLGPVWTAGGTWQLTAATKFTPGQQVRRDWNKAVVRTALPSDLDSAAARDGGVGAITAAGLLDSGSGQWAVMRNGTDKELTTVYRDGVLLGTAPATAVAFPVVPERAEYRVVTDVQRQEPGWNTSTKVRTDWRFHSAQGEGRTLLPVLSVDYRLGTDLANSARPMSRTTVGLGVRHPKGLTGPAITKVQLWASYDDGASWRQVRLDGRLNGTIDNPATAGFVSLRTTATDADGNTVDQTVTRAYQIRR